MFGDIIPPQFIRFAADILGDTEDGLSGGKIVNSTTAYRRSRSEHSEDPPFARAGALVAIHLRQDGGIQSAQGWSGFQGARKLLVDGMAPRNG